MPIFFNHNISHNMLAFDAYKKNNYVLKPQ